SPPDGTNSVHDGSGKGSRIPVTAASCTLPALPSLVAVTLRATFSVDERTLVVSLKASSTAGWLSAAGAPTRQPAGLGGAGPALRWRYTTPADLAADFRFVPRRNRSSSRSSPKAVRGSRACAWRSTGTEAR